jgi:hypothetical protein
VLELTGISQPVSSSGFIFVLSCGCEPAAGAVEMWESGLLLAGFPSPVERVGNSLFEFSTLSRGRHFHRAFHLVVLGAKRRSSFIGARFFVLGQNLPSPPKILRQSG